ncbi:MAG: M48 family metallopeptidase [Methylobacterium sp.]|nr:M48 family metallopeptidase [Methylobacterium sp.]
MSRQQLTLPDGGVIPYLLKVSPRRRTVGLRIDRNGLSVHVPDRISQTFLNGILLQKSAWILRKLAERQDYAPPPLALEDGAMLQYLGQDIRLCLRQDAANRAPEFDGTRLHLCLPQPQDSQAVQRRLAGWFAKQARADFTRRVALLAARLGVPTPPVFLSNARTRWGSCNARGEIRLHWRLVQAPPQIIHYVVAHELAHLKEMNHSPRFWQWVETLCPDYKVAREALKALSAQLHLL